MININNKKTIDTRNLENDIDIPDYIKYKFQRLLRQNSHPIEKTKMLFRFAIQHFYSQIVEEITTLKNRKIVVTGLVLNDGVGDYHHIINVAEQLKKNYENLKIDVIPFIISNNYDSLKKLDNTKYDTHFCKYEILANNPTILEILEKSDLIIHASVPAHNACLFKNKTFYVLEYGQPSLHSMGAKNYDLGIAISENLQFQSLIHLENNVLKNVLFNTVKPSNIDLQNYSANHELFSAYLKSGSLYQMTYIYTIAATQKNSTKQIIDICIPDVDIDILEIDYLKAMGIGKIKVIQFEKENFIEKELILSEEHKELRLINPFPLVQKDYFNLIANGNRLVGCTGDHSLSEVISFNQLPFYELRDTKKVFWHDMTKLAKKMEMSTHYLKDYFSKLRDIFSTPISQKELIDYYRNPGKYSSLAENIIMNKFKFIQSYLTQYAQDIAKILQHPELIDELYQFNKLLKEHYNFNPILKDIFARKLVKIVFPELKNYEKEVLEKYNNCEIDIYSVNQLLKYKIKNFLKEFKLNETQAEH